MEKLEHTISKQWLMQNSSMLDLEKEVHSLRIQLHEMAGSAAASKRDVIALEAELDNKDSLLRRRDDEIEVLNASARELNSKLDVRTRLLDEKEAMLRECEGQLKDCTAARENDSRARERLHEEIETLKNTSLDSREEMAIQASDLKDSLFAALAEGRTLRQRLQEREQEVTSMASHVTGLRSRITLLEDELAASTSERNQERGRSESEAVDAAVCIAELQAALKSMGERASAACEKLAWEVEGAANEVIVWKKRCQDLRTVNENKTEEIKTARRDLSSTRKALTAEREAAEDHTVACAKVKEQLRRLQRSKDMNSSRLSSQFGRYAKSREQAEIRIEELESALSKSRVENNKLRGMMEDMELALSHSPVKTRRDVDVTNGSCRRRTFLLSSP